MRAILRRSGYVFTIAQGSDEGGSGVGLAIAARVFTLHNGTIAASNLAPHGLSVRMTLPLRLA